MRFLILASWLGLLAIAVAVPVEQATAQRQQQPSSQTSPTPTAPAGEARAPQPSQRQHPADVTRAFTLDLPGRTLKFAATAGSVPFRSSEGRLLAELGYIAYVLEGAEATRRPVTFAFNGGPGSSSVWVHLGGFGPWRMALEGAGLAPSANPTLLPNAETWLDFTDLVFVDPAATGFSRIARPPSDQANAGGGGGRGSGGGRDAGGSGFFHSVEGDAAAMAEFIERWSRQTGRLASPKIIAGESYGGIRAPKVAGLLQSQFAAGVNGLILISPVLDFGYFRVPRHHPTTFVNALPTIAAAAREAAGKPVEKRSDLAAIEAYARTEYLVDLQRGPRDGVAMDRLVKRVAAISGFSETVVRGYGARIDEAIYLREANRPAGQRASGYDASVRGDDPDPTALFQSWADPFTDALTAPMRNGILAVYDRIGVKTELDFNISSRDAFSNWSWGPGNSRPESFTSLRAALALDPRLQVLVTHGFTDLRTPYFASVFMLDQLPPFAEGRVALEVYPGGHMHYSRDGSRVALRNDAKALIERILAADPSRR